MRLHSFPTRRSSDLAGGLAYSLGTVFYVMKRVRYMHAVWHLFVLAGSVLQFLAIVLYIVPQG